MQFCSVSKTATSKVDQVSQFAMLPHVPKIQNKNKPYEYKTFKVTAIYNMRPRIYIFKIEL